MWFKAVIICYYVKIIYVTHCWNHASYEFHDFAVTVFSTLCQPISENDFYAPLYKLLIYRFYSVYRDRVKIQGGHQ
jgi:hypothetical protein